MANTALFAKTMPRALAKLKMMYSHASGDSIVPYVDRQWGCEGFKELLYVHDRSISEPVT